MAYGDPTGVDKILVERYGYEWVNGKAWPAGTAPEPEIPAVDVTAGPLPDWIIPPPADAFVTEALETLTNPITGEQFTVPTGGYTVNVSTSEDNDTPSTEPITPIAIPDTDPVPSEPVSLEERLEQLQASLNELQKKYEEALEKLEQAHARLEQANAKIAELELQQGEPSEQDPNPDEVAREPEETPRPEPQQPAVEEEADVVQTETPEVSEPEPEPIPEPSYPEPTGIDKILVETYGYEWVNGKAWPAGTAPEPEVTQIDEETLIGTEGDDILIGGGGNDTINGLDGNDTLDGGAGNDTLEGGDGNDTYKYAYDGSDTVSDTSGTDTIYLTTRDSSGNSYWGDGGYFSGNDLVISSTSTSLDKLTIKDAKLSSSGIETITYHAADNKWADNTLKIALNGEVSDTTHLMYFGTLGDDIIAAGKAYAEIYLNNGDDTASPGDGGGWAQGGDGNDTLTGGIGSDNLYSGSGNDTLDGGAGNDTLEGGGGDDTLTGGPGSDTFIFGLNFGNDTITDFDPSLDTLEFSQTPIIKGGNLGFTTYTTPDGSTVTVGTVAASNPNHHAFTSGGNYFTLVSSAKSYRDAVDYASSMGGTLATFNSSTKFDGFYGALSNVITDKGLTPTNAADGGGAQYVWLGATDQLSEGTWIWENGSQMAFDNWGSGAYGSEPDNFNNQDGLAIGLENWPAGSADGAGYGDAGFWNDVDTSNELFFVVEMA